MDVDFDLFGNPVRTGGRGRGRPAFEVTREKLNKVRLGLALGWSKQRIANGLACSTKTLDRYFSPELKERAMARDQLDLHRFDLLMAEANKGNVGAIKELGRMLDRNDSMTATRVFDDAQAAPKAEKPKPLGKKEAAQLEAETAGGAHTLWGDDLSPGYGKPN